MSNLKWIHCTELQLSRALWFHVNNFRGFSIDFRLVLNQKHWNSKLFNDPWSIINVNKPLVRYWRIFLCCRKSKRLSKDLPIQETTWSLAFRWPNVIWWRQMGQLLFGVCFQFYSNSILTSATSLPSSFVNQVLTRTLWPNSHFSLAKRRKHSL